MRKNQLFKLISALLVLLFFFSCEEDVKPPQPDFSSNYTTVTEGETVSFTDLSTNSPREWQWTFQGGTPFTSSVQNPTVTYNEVGSHYVTLIVRNEGGVNEITKSGYITVNPLPPQPDFYASEYSSTNTEITMLFTDQSSNSPDEWFWTFEGGYPSTSTQQNPTVTYSSSGTYDVTLTARNNGGEKETVKYNYINVGGFNNPTWTEIDITVNSETKTIPVDGYALFAQTDYTSMSYYAETYGETSTGTQIGLLIYWDNTVDLYEYSTWNLIINSDYVFFNVTNYGSDDLYPFYVNWATTEQSVDLIVIENDGYTKSTGYYDAYDYMEVRAYKYSDSNSGTSWIENTHFYLPWENNQGIYLSNNLKSALEYKSVSKEVENSEEGIIMQTGAK